MYFGCKPLSKTIHVMVWGNEDKTINQTLNLNASVNIQGNQTDLVIKQNKKRVNKKEILQVLPQDKQFYCWSLTF